MNRYFQRGHAAMRQARGLRDAAVPPARGSAGLPPAVAFPTSG